MARGKGLVKSELFFGRHKASKEGTLLTTIMVIHFYVFGRDMKYHIDYHVQSTHVVTRKRWGASINEYRDLVEERRAK